MKDSAGARSGFRGEGLVFGVFHVYGHDTGAVDGDTTRIHTKWNREEKKLAKDRGELRHALDVEVTSRATLPSVPLPNIRRALNSILRRSESSDGAGWDCTRQIHAIFGLVQDVIRRSNLPRRHTSHGTLAPRLYSAQNFPHAHLGADYAGSVSTNFIWLMGATNYSCGFFGTPLSERFTSMIGLRHVGSFAPSNIPPSRVHFSRVYMNLPVLSTLDVSGAYFWSFSLVHTTPCILPSVARFELQGSGSTSGVKLFFPRFRGSPFKLTSWRHPPVSFSVASSYKESPVGSRRTWGIYLTMVLVRSKRRRGSRITFKVVHVVLALVYDANLAAADFAVRTLGRWESWWPRVRADLKHLRSPVGTIAVIASGATQPSSPELMAKFHVVIPRWFVLYDFSVRLQASPHAADQWWNIEACSGRSVPRA
ncbi:hypothetical protein C8R44DRAFT_748002 [Mycena epipterygia]|nr:hypothetical protein C8R44DRAFT_748002 [Mycena epipterygia]